MSTGAASGTSAAASPIERRLPVGAEVGEAGVHFRVWAPRRRRVGLVLEGDGRTVEREMEREPDGYFSLAVAEARPGDRYRFRLDEDPALYPDPASRFQPEGPHGPSRIVDPTTFPWTDQAWRGVPRDGQILYELHVGTFTPEGTWAAALRELPALAELGVTVLEVMPVADFPGRFGWGYDGVDLFAPTRLYGEPDDFRRFVDRAHALGMGVILDVVYNHCGPDGCYWTAFSERYLSDRHTTEWGDAINFDGDESAAVREFFLANVRYWIEEFHLDGFRLDATQSMFDDSERHILGDMVARAREAAGGRSVLLVAENEPQDVRLLRPGSEGGFGLDLLWNDDWHHTAMVALTGRREAYYLDYRGSPQELISAAKRGFLYQGQRYEWQDKRRGTPTRGLEPGRFVNFLQNHDQVANSGGGERLHRLTSPGRHRAMTALLLLLPGTPMLFMGQEFAASSPFLYFADHNPELATLVRKGRTEFLTQFPSLARDEMRARLADPGSPETVHRCRLDHAERDRHREAYALHRDLIALRREEPLFASAPHGLDGAVLAPRAFVLRWFAPDGADRLLLVNLGAEEPLGVVPEPLLAPPHGMRWRERWSSEHPRYGGRGAPPVESPDGRWRLPAEAAVVLVPEHR